MMEEFDYENIVSNFWRDVLSEARERQDVSFDTENNDSAGDVKEIKVGSYVDFNEEEKQYRFMYQMWKAGGDWQNSVIYFRVQYNPKNEYTANSLFTKYGKNAGCFVYIPIKNNSLVAKQGGGWVASEDDDREKPDEYAAFEELKSFLEKEVMKKDTEIASQLLMIAKDIFADANGLNGMNNLEARKFVNALLSKHTRGIFSDDYWRPVKDIFKELKDQNIPYEMNGTQYFKDYRGNPNSKVWKFNIEFENDRRRKTTLYGVITASGAGSVDEPLSRYDLTAYVS